MTQTIGQEFNTWKLLKFAFPSMVMMVFLSLYTIVDGMFISRLVGSDALSAANIAYPIVGILIAVSVMLATGGSAVVARKMGEKKEKEAKEIFTMIIATGTIFAVVYAVLVILFAEPLSYWMGADEVLLPYCKEYMIYITFFAVACMLQTLYQNLLVTAGKPRLGMFLTIVAGIVNAILDYAFMGIWHWGIKGAAIATGIGQMIPAVVGTILFCRRKGELYFVAFSMRWKELLKSCTNGSSEMVTNLSNSVVMLMFNLILMKMAGSDGVAAITIILYGQFVFSALYMGFGCGVAPIFSYHFGANNIGQLKKLLKISLIFISMASVILAGLSYMGAAPVSTAFVPENSGAWALSKDGFQIFSVTYLFCGMNIFASSFFTALSDGKDSALISFLRTFVFTVAALLILPKLFGISGVWMAVPAAELITFFVSIILMMRFTRFNLQKVHPVIPEQENRYS